jgi:hypothetical protein
MHTGSSGGGVVVLPVATDASDHSALQVVLNAHAAVQQVPRASHVVVCSSSTSWVEIELLLMRLQEGVVGLHEQGAQEQVRASGVNGGVDLGVASEGGFEEEAGCAEEFHSRVGMGGSNRQKLVDGARNALYCLVDVHRLQGSVQLQLLEGLRKLQAQGMNRAADVETTVRTAEAGADVAREGEGKEGACDAAARTASPMSHPSQSRQYITRQLLVTFEAAEASLLKDSFAAAAGSAGVAAVLPYNLGSSASALVAARGGDNGGGGVLSSFGFMSAGQLLASLNRHLGRRLVVLTSDHPGQGKSATAARLAATLQQQVRTVAVVDDMGPEQLIEQLVEWDSTCEMLHLNLLSSRSAAGMDTMLLQLLVLGFVSSGAGGTAYHLPQQQYNVVVEVGNTLGDKLFNSLQLAVAAPLADPAVLKDLGEAVADRATLFAPSKIAAAATDAAASGRGGVTLEAPTAAGQGMCGAARTSAAAAAGTSAPIVPLGYFRLLCSFSLDQLQLTNPAARTVCSYLQALNQGWLDTQDVIPEQHCPHHPARQQLLQTYFIAPQEQQGVPVTYALVRNFIKILGQQLQHFSHSVFFKVESLAWAHHGQVGCVRSALVQGLLQASVVQVVESCTAARAAQHANMTSSTAAAAAVSGDGAVTAAQLAARGSGIVQWQDCNHMLLLFNARDHYQTITALYRLNSQLPASFQQLLNSQREAIQDYSRMGQYELYDQLQMLVGQPGLGDFPEGPVYVLTPDNLLKMAMIHLRITSGIPVVMMGDTS